MASGPTRLIIADIHDRRNRFDYYWPRLKKLNIPTPRTKFIPLKKSKTKPAEWNTNEIISVLNNWGVDRAFIRSQYKAAPLHIQKGSYIESINPISVDRTISSLLSQLQGEKWEHGDSLVLREWIDLSFCLNHQHNLCHPRVRYFLEDGCIIGSTPTLNECSFICNEGYQYLQPLLDNIDETTPQMHAQKVADEFTEDTWAVDFEMSTSGTWYCIEMGLNAVQWDDKVDDWLNHCGHGDIEAFSPREIHSSVLNPILLSADKNANITHLF